MNATAPSPQRIAQRLRGKRLLLTGATGLLGKVFMEKLLRSAPQIGRIHLLIRNRVEGATGNDRLETEVLRSSVFDRLRALLGPGLERLCREKITVVDGDLTREHFGMSDDDYTALTQQVDVIVNSAAAVTFDERLDISLQLNMLGPTRLLKLARDCGGVPFLQVSTCYVSGRRTGQIPEEVSQPDRSSPIDIDDVIRRMTQICADITADKRLQGEALRRALIDAGMELAHRHGWNDTYTFTKWLGEQLVERDRGDIPVVILRPAIIEGCFEEPVPGWIDGLRMADPMIMAFGRGKLREFPADPAIPIDVIPCDFVANAMVAALPVGQPPGTKRIYHVASSRRNPLLISRLAQDLSTAFRRRPMFDDAGRQIKTGRFRLVRQEAFTSKWLKKLTRITQYRRLLERLRIGPERRLRLSAAVAQIEQILYLAKIYSPYTHLDCRFLDENLKNLAELLHPDDLVEFPFAVERLDWSDYIINRHIPGLRRFVLGGSKHAARPAGATGKPGRRDDLIREARHHSASIFQTFERVAQLCADSPALQMNRAGRWIIYSYEEALAATAAIARRFGELGLEPGDRIVLCGDNCPEWGLTYLAAMRAGLTAVPLDPQLAPGEVFACGRFASTKLICAGRSTFAALATEAAGGREAAPIVQMAEPFVPPPGASRDAGPPPVHVGGDHTASILFTSGTTLAPKAVPLTHDNLLSNARALLSVHPLQSSESFLSVLPMYHAFEFTGGFLVPMIIGATVTYVEQLKGPFILAAMQAVRPTLMQVVPRLLKLFHDSIIQKVRESGVLTRAAVRTFGWLSDLSGGAAGSLLFRRVHRQFGGRLRMFISGGSALDRELFAAFTRLGFEVCEGYGLTETSPVLTVNPPGAGKSGSVGEAVPGVELHLHNPNSEGVGELWARGAVVMPGYLNNPDATAEVMRDGWFRTGDLCRRDAEGYYFVTGRVKDMIVTQAGKNVYPDEVEMRYRDLPYVKELCVVGLPNASGIGESVHAVIVPDYDAHPDMPPTGIERAIREAVEQMSGAIPAHQRIQTVHFWTVELPKTSTLKARRGRIKEILGDDLNGSGRAAERVISARESKPRPAAERLNESQLLVRRLLAKLTHETESSIHSDSNLLLDLGMDSLMKLQLLGELESHFDIACSNEQGAALARVSDLFALVRNSPPLHGAKRAGRSWRERQRSVAATTIAGASNGALTAPVQAARWAARGGMALLFNSYIRVRARGFRHIPASGPFILAANHSSHLDAASVITAVAGRRRVWVAGAQDYFFSTILKGWVFGKLLDTIPFDRHAEGYAGLSRCLEQLERGDGLLFFPEGTRSPTGRMADFKIGVALMAVEAGAPVIPTRIDHAYELMPKGSRLARPGVVHIAFGKPIAPQPWKCSENPDRQYALYREFAREVQSRVADLGQRFSAKLEARR